MEEVFLNAAGRGDLYVMECLFNLDCNFKSLLEKTLRKDSARTLPYQPRLDRGQRKDGFSVCAHPVQDVSTEKPDLYS
ncbi:hypothetical protein GQ600_1960 [Phytophthora cactorum]|nr:hypothetical protein GQ600_1960 [Phytophthora cactorum]